MHDPYMLQLGLILKECILRNFAFCNFCWKIGCHPLNNDLVTLRFLNILNGINIENVWLIYAATKVYFKKLYFTFFYNILALSL